jgi:16S rRNA (guanine527-N7)-methyltransferase
VRAHVPGLGDAPLARLASLAALVRDWNERVNLVSRKDVEHLEEHHLLHSLLAARVWRPAPGARAVDLGTGGGFPGLPLAIVFPEVRFTLVDSIAKKARAVADMAAALELGNVRVLSVRAEAVRDRFDYVLGRAVAPLPEFLRWAAPLLRPRAAGEPPNGILYFKGTLWREELAGARTQPGMVWPLHRLVPRPYFEEKFLLHFPAPVHL